MQHEGLKPDAPRLAQVLGYWQALRGADGCLPRRSDFDPRGIADALEGTMLLERIALGQVRIRLAGTQLCDLIGMDLRGMPLSTLVTPESRAMLADRVEAVFDNPAIARLQVSGESGFLRAPLRGTLMILPMLGRSGLADRALATLALDRTSAQPSPRRLALTRAALSPIDDVPRAVSPMPAPRDPVASLCEAAEHPAPFDPAPRPPRGRPSLRLVKG